jgi:two-component system, cell cycle sensor histidine kinase and response regulator CckA
MAEWRLRRESSGGTDTFKAGDWLERIPMPAIVVAADLRLLRWNAEAAGLLHVTTSGEHLPWLERRLLPLLHDEAASSVIARRAGGSRRAYRLRCRHLSAHEALVLFSECTAELQARTAERAADRRLRLQYERVRDAVLIEQDDRIAWANDAARTLLERRGEALHNLPAAQVLPHDIIAGLGSGAHESVEVVLATMSGERHIRVLPLPIRYRGRDARQLLLLDLSALRTAEDNLRESETLLRRAQRMESVGRLTAGIAHDFNNMLAAIHGHALFLLEGLPEGSEAHADALEISRAVTRASELTKQLLSFSRGRGRAATPVNLNAVILGMERLLQRLLSGDTQLQLELADNLPETRGDVGLIEQVIMNLVLNAREALRSGGAISITTGRASAANVRVIDGLPLDAGDYVLISVSDTGCGMTHAVRHCIFDPFFTTKADGTGLGLATVLNIVTGLGGAVDVQSEPDAGSTFTILLPVAAQSQAI